MGGDRSSAASASSGLDRRKRTRINLNGTSCPRTATSTTHRQFETSVIVAFPAAPTGASAVYRAESPADKPISGNRLWIKGVAEQEHEKEGVQRKSRMHLQNGLRGSAMTGDLCQPACREIVDDRNVSPALRPLLLSPRSKIEFVTIEHPGDLQADAQTGKTRTHVDRVTLIERVLGLSSSRFSSNYIEFVQIPPARP